MEAYPTYDMFTTPLEYKAMDLEQQREAKNVIPEQDLPDYARQEWEDLFTYAGFLKPRQSLSELVDPYTGQTAMEYAKDQYNIGEKWRNLINTKGMRGTQDTRYAGGGIAGIRRPHSIPPESGPAPQGEGLSYLFNRDREW
jgi:hypothetical protein